MPSPVGHAVAGLIIALAGGRESTARLKSRPTLEGGAVPWTLVFICALLAAAPDLDYIYPPIHRGPSHSIGAAALVTLIAAAVTRWTSGQIRWRIALVCGLAYSSHILMDWLGEDPTPRPGVMAFWPFSDKLFMSSWSLFRSTWRIDPLAPGNFEHNLLALAREMVVLGPFAVWALWRRTK